MPRGFDAYLRCGNGVPLDCTRVPTNRLSSIAAARLVAFATDCVIFPRCRRSRSRSHRLGMRRSSSFVRSSSSSSVALASGDAANAVWISGLALLRARLDADGPAGHAKRAHHAAIRSRRHARNRQEQRRSAVRAHGQGRSCHSNSPPEDGRSRAVALTAKGTRSWPERIQNGSRDRFSAADREHPPDANEGR